MVLARFRSCTNFPQITQTALFGVFQPRMEKWSFMPAPAHALMMVRSNWVLCVQQYTTPAIATITTCNTATPAAGSRTWEHALFCIRRWNRFTEITLSGRRLYIFMTFFLWKNSLNYFPWSSRSISSFCRISPSASPSIQPLAIYLLVHHRYRWFLDYINKFIYLFIYEVDKTDSGCSWFAFWGTRLFTYILRIIQMFRVLY